MARSTVLLERRLPATEHPEASRNSAFDPFAFVVTRGIATRAVADATTTHDGRGHHLLVSESHAISSGPERDAIIDAMRFTVPADGRVIAPGGERPEDGQAASGVAGRPSALRSRAHSA